jgi:hypothetical protein
VTSDEAADLLNLRCLWQEAYAITLSDGVWSARRHDTAGGCAPLSGRLDSGVALCTFVL